MGGFINHYYVANEDEHWLLHGARKYVYIETRERVVVRTCARERGSLGVEEGEANAHYLTSRLLSLILSPPSPLLSLPSLLFPLPLNYLRYLVDPSVALRPHRERRGDGGDGGGGGRAPPGPPGGRHEGIGKGKGVSMGSAVSSIRKGLFGSLTNKRGEREAGKGDSRGSGGAERGGRGNDGRGVGESDNGGGSGGNGGGKSVSLHFNLDLKCPNLSLFSKVGDSSNLKLLSYFHSSLSLVPRSSLLFHKAR